MFFTMPLEFGRVYRIGVAKACGFRIEASGLKFVDNASDQLPKFFIVRMCCGLVQFIQNRGSIRMHSQRLYDVLVVRPTHLVLPSNAYWIYKCTYNPHQPQSTQVIDFSFQMYAFRRYPGDWVYNEAEANMDMICPNCPSLAHHMRP